MTYVIAASVLLVARSAGEDAAERFLARLFDTDRVEI